MLTLPYALATLFAIGGGIQLAQLDKQVAASRALKPGDDEARVLEALGEPKMRCPHGLSLFNFGSGQSQWIYGTDIDVTKIIDSESMLPNLLPINLRLFSPEQSDLVIKWENHGHIAAIQRPARVGH